MTKELLQIKAFNKNDIPVIVENFARHNWPKPHSVFEKYLDEQKNRERIVWLAFYQQAFAGYITLKWHSLYASFREQNIPEIMDLNVLPPSRNKGIGTALLDLAEAEVVKTCPVVGLGVGLYKDYGCAQKLYVKRGYMPDGLGITYNYQPLEPDSQACLDDDLILWFTKKLT